MSNIELTDKIREYREYARMIEEMTAIKDAIADNLKAFMNAANETKMIIGEYKLSYTDCKRTDIDKKALQTDRSDREVLPAPHGECMETIKPVTL